MIDSKNGRNVNTGKMGQPGTVQNSRTWNRANNANCKNLVPVMIHIPGLCIINNLKFMKSASFAPQDSGSIVSYFKNLVKVQNDLNVSTHYQEFCS